MNISGGEEIHQPEVSDEPWYVVFGDQGQLLPGGSASACPLFGEE
jgi:hypothetical protein